MKSLPKGAPAAQTKSIKSEDLGNITGRRGAGMTTITSGNPLMHMMGHYGKDAPPLITDMVGGMTPHAHGERTQDDGISSMNLGTEGVNACFNLGNNSDFVMFRAALLETARSQMNQALDLGTADAIGYARATRDLWQAIEAAATNQKIQVIKKPAPMSTTAVQHVR